MQISFVDDLDSMNPSFDVIGPLVESCTACYPERVNAEFVQVDLCCFFACIGLKLVHLFGLRVADFVCVHKLILTNSLSCR